MGTRGELERMVDELVASGVRPRIDRILDLFSAADGLAALEAGEVLGKVVLAL
jgi:D-arabinose 1-dehydrogenase-like Zn-dependent alcohol dehydrogenase